MYFTLLALELEPGVVLLGTPLHSTSKEFFGEKASVINAVCRNVVINAVCHNVMTRTGGSQVGTGTGQSMERVHARAKQQGRGYATSWIQKILLLLCL